MLREAGLVTLVSVRQDGMQSSCSLPIFPSRSVPVTVADRESDGIKLLVRITTQASSADLINIRRMYETPFFRFQFDKPSVQAAVRSGLSAASTAIFSQTDRIKFFVE